MSGDVRILRCCDLGSLGRSLRPPTPDFPEDDELPRCRGLRRKTSSRGVEELGSLLDEGLFRTCMQVAVARHSPMKRVFRHPVDPCLMHLPTEVDCVGSRGALGTPDGLRLASGAQCNGLAYVTRSRRCGTTSSTTPTARWTTCSPLWRTLARTLVGRL